MSNLKDDISKIEAAEQSATGWVKTHHAWVMALSAFVIGAILGHLV